MSARAASLEQIQRWMQSVIMHPGGVAEGVDSPEARRHLDVALADLPSVIAPSRAMESSARLEIYVDAYYERLLECLREEFTAMRTAVGDELFQALAFGYLQHYPSRSYTLNALGANFPIFLAETRLHADELPSGAGATWPDFVIELATFERLMRDVFDSPGIEGQAVLDLAALAEIPARRWGRLRLVPAPCLRLCRFQHPVHEFWAALKEGLQPSPPTPRATCLAIHRRDYIVERHEFAPVPFALLEHLVAGKTLAEAIAQVAESPQVDWPALESEIQAWFAHWTSQGFFVEAQVSDHTSPE